MHMGQELRDEADKHSIHVVIAGHMSSDSLGINLFLDELERQRRADDRHLGPDPRAPRRATARSPSEEPGALPLR